MQILNQVTYTVEDNPANNKWRKKSGIIRLCLKTEPTHIFALSGTVAWIRKMYQELTK